MFETPHNSKATSPVATSVEAGRLHDEVDHCPWRAFGPYLSDRQWGTVREDYSADGSAWDYFTHDDARHRAYRWGEDGLAGFCDSAGRLCFAIALWNGKDPILKERLFGLANSQGNHGEDVKEYYWHQDAVPSHAYQRMMYRYPQVAYPYDDLVKENARRGFNDREYELIDTGVLDENRFFDVSVEYAKADTQDILMRIEVHNHGPEASPIDVLPHVWFRNTWSWDEGASRPLLHQDGASTIRIQHPDFKDWSWTMEGPDELLFTENDTNPRIMWNLPAEGWYKDAFHEYVTGGDQSAVNPDGKGTKAAGRVRHLIPAGESMVIRVRFGQLSSSDQFKEFDEIVSKRRAEADDFYQSLAAGMDDPESIDLHRRAHAGLLWTKQCYHYDVDRWLAGDSTMPPPPPERLTGRNHQWTHLDNHDVLLMPDSWEYPWYAAWDLAFHCVTLVETDPALAKKQLRLFTREWYMHPNGELPAYEWSLGDVNPPVHAWAAWRVFQIDRRRRGDEGDLDFLEAVFHKLMLNFTWWVNREDDDDRNVFEGGFLGLDNIGVFDRSAELPTGGCLDQADGTSWMAMYSLNLLRIAIELAQTRPAYQDIASKFFEHFLRIAYAMNNVGGDDLGLWDEEDEFFYDVLRTPDGRSQPLRVRSMVGLIPLFAVEVINGSMLEKLPEFIERAKWLRDARPELAALVSRWHDPGKEERRLLSLLRAHRMQRILARMLDPEEFLSPHGIRALSRYHLDHPYLFKNGKETLQVKYASGESNQGLFGGNSNWRGPIWFPVNFLIIESLQKFQYFYGDDLKVECPVGSGTMLTLGQVADEIRQRLLSLFKINEDGKRPFYGDDEQLQNNPLFQNEILFHEYFDGDTGRGCGASHQTGWTALAAKLCLPRRPGT